jgi:hypothetical protein
MNGAPEFKVTYDDDNTILDAEKNNINQYPITLVVIKVQASPAYEGKHTAGIC